MSEILRGAEIFVRALADEGVEYVFGYPGGAVLHIYDEVFKQDKVKHVLVRHEQGATHAADGYAEQPVNLASFWSPRARAQPIALQVSQPLISIPFRSLSSLDRFPRV